MSPWCYWRGKRGGESALSYFLLGFREEQTSSTQCGGQIPISEETGEFLVHVLEFLRRSVVGVGWGTRQNGGEGGGGV